MGGGIRLEEDDEVRYGAYSELLEEKSTVEEKPEELTYPLAEDEKLSDGEDVRGDQAEVREGREDEAEEAVEDDELLLLVVVPLPGATEQLKPDQPLMHVQVNTPGTLLF